MDKVRFSGHTQYELSASFQLIKDVRERFIDQGPHPRGFFNHMNELIIETSINSTWKYNTPTLMLATRLLASIVDASVVNESQPLFAQMDVFIRTVNDFCDHVQRDQIIGILDDALAQIELVS